MKWFNKGKRIWRLSFLAMLVVAMIGPWFFDRINVPQPYTCHLPNVRLDDDFCGVPVSILWILGMMPSTFVYLMDALIKGIDRPYNYAGAEWLTLLFSIFLILPFLSTVLLVIWDKQQRLMKIHLISLGLAAGTSLLVLAFSFASSSWMLWGVWLYVILTVGQLAVEILTVSKKQLTVS
jgi:hypothetical protein